MSDNWVVQNLQNALDTWNSKLAEIWQILTQSPETFKGGGIWQVIVQIHGALQAIVDGLGAIVNSSRGIIAAYKQEKYKEFGAENYADASRAAVKDMIADISGALENR